MALVNDERLSNEIRKTVSNLENTSGQFALFSAKMNDGNGTLSRLVTDEKIGKTLDSTIYNIQQATKKLDENMEALQHNFLFRGFFKKKAKADAKKAVEVKQAANLKPNTDVPATEEVKIKMYPIHTNPGSGRRCKTSSRMFLPGGIIITSSINHVTFCRNHVISPHFNKSTFDK